MGRPDAQLHRRRQRACRQVARRRAAGDLDAVRSAPATRPSWRTMAGSTRCIASATAARGRDRGRPKKPSSRSTRRPGRRSGSTSTRRGARTSALAPARTRRRSSSAIASSRSAPTSSCSRSTSERQDPVVARSHQGIQLTRAAHSARRQDRLWLQPDRLPRHDHLQCRRARAIGDGVSAKRRRASSGRAATS